jgi:hypothetical protein
MAFSTISSALIQVGKAIKKELFQTIKDDLDDLDSRTAALEVTGSFIEIIDETIYSATTAATLTGVYFYKVKQNTRITKVEVQIFDKGSISSGSVTIDLKKASTLGGTFTSIMTTLPTINFATASNYDSNSGVINAVLNDLVTNEFIRVDFTALPSTPLPKCRVIVTGELY